MKHVVHRLVRHRRSIRLKDYDYSQAGAYFVTVCTRNRKCILGDIQNSNVVLNEIGQIVERTWIQLPSYFKTIDIDKFVVMPNHIHGIIMLTSHCRGGVTPPLRRPTLGQIVAYFKYQATKSINRLSNTPGNRVWQRNYYEHITRNEEDLNEIRGYILNNPPEWALDEENPDNFKQL